MKRLLLLVLVLFIALPALAQQSPRFPDLDSARRAAIVDSVTTALDTVYVFPDVATEMVNNVRKKLKDGRYDEFTDVMSFTNQLTEDFQAISKDLHLRVGAGPLPSAEEMEDPEIASQRERRNNQFRNYNFDEAVRLPGNVGYLKFDGFSGDPESGATAVAAMNFLGHCDALIIDLTENGGGSPSMIQLLTSYLVDEPTHLNSFYRRVSDDMKQFWTLPYVPGPSMADIPVYVLTSGRTFSAAEEFTYNLKNLERATIVGETTGGGAHPVTRHTFDFPEYQVGMALPFGRAINPITGTNWEGTGIDPHLACKKAEAKETAYLHALETLESGCDDPTRKDALSWIRSGIAAKQSPIELSTKELKQYAGDFGPRHIKREDDQLVYQRDDRDPYPMIPMGDDMFMFEDLDYFRIQFERDDKGKVVKLVGIYENGRRDGNDRDK
jgi:retinol-binding protein 3